MEMVNMIDPNIARTRLHAMIDELPDEQVALVWMTFQSMLADDVDDDEIEEEDYGDVDDE